MEVSETKLVNFAEKTKFDVSSEITGPSVENFGGTLGYEMQARGITLIYPEVSTLLKSDGTWDETNTPTFKFKYRDPDTGLETIYDSLSNIPNVSAIALADLQREQDAFVEHWKDFLRTLRPESQTVSVFQLDPNQLLTISDGYKVLLKRPL